jgi:hypothetical protein
MEQSEGNGISPWKENRSVSETCPLTHSSGLFPLYHVALIFSLVNATTYFFEIKGNSLVMTILKV